MRLTSKIAHPKAGAYHMYTEHQMGIECGVFIVCFKLALKQGFSALVTVISLIYSAVCDAGSCLDLQQPAVEPFLSATGLLLVFLRGNADLASFARANQR